MSPPIVEPRVPPLKIWQFPILLSEHAFDKLRLIDCTFAEFELALAGATVIEQHDVSSTQRKELLLLIRWVRLLHVVVVVDEVRREERIVTLYEPDR